MCCCSCLTRCVFWELNWVLLNTIATIFFNRRNVAQSQYKGPSTLATLFNHMWPRIVAGIFIPVGNHYFQALASTLQFVAQVCDRLWLVHRAFAYITYMSSPHVALVWPPQCAATCGWKKWPVCSGPYPREYFYLASVSIISNLNQSYLYAFEFRILINFLDCVFNSVCLNC